MFSRLFSKRTANQLFAVNDPSISVAIGCLRIVVAIQGFGLAGRYLFSSFEIETDVYELLFFDLGYSENLAQAFDDLGVYVCLITSIVVLLNEICLLSLSARKTESISLKILGRLESAGLVLSAVWVVMISIAHSIRGEPFARLALGEDAVRFVVPLALLLLCSAASLNSGRLARFVFWILAVSSAVTFGVHGYKAIQIHGPFVDLILLSDMNWSHWGLEQTTAERMLKLIGWIDLGLAVILLIGRWPIVLYYMTVWGLLTAFSRLTAFGMIAWPETMMRVANWGVPLVLILMLRSIHQSQNVHDQLNNKNSIRASTS